METIFRKVLVTDRMPEKGKEVFAINKYKDICYGTIHDHYSDFGMEYFCENENENMEDITYWLEEIQLPNDDDMRTDIDRVHKQRSISHPQENLHRTQGAKWLRDLVLGCSPISEGKAEKK